MIRAAMAGAGHGRDRGVRRFTLIARRDAIVDVGHWLAFGPAAALGRSCGP
jgi:hypothetical protein